MTTGRRRGWKTASGVVAAVSLVLGTLFTSMGWGNATPVLWTGVALLTVALVAGLAARGAAEARAVAFVEHGLSLAQAVWITIGVSVVSLFFVFGLVMSLRSTSPLGAAFWLWPPMAVATLVWTWRRYPVDAARRRARTRPLDLAGDPDLQAALHRIRPGRADAWLGLLLVAALGSMAAAALLERLHDLVRQAVFFTGLAMLSVATWGLRIRVWLRHEQRQETAQEAYERAGARR